MVGNGCIVYVSYYKVKGSDGSIYEMPEVTTVCSGGCPLDWHAVTVAFGQSRCIPGRQAGDSVREPRDRDRDRGNSSGYDWSVFWHGVLHGDRQPGQSFAACVDQNIKETTFGQIDPQKLAKVIPAAAVGVAGALAGKIPFNIPFDPGTGGITAFTASAFGLGRALGVGGTAMGGLVGAANAVGYGLAIAGAATAGLVIGSAINCR